MDNVSPEQSKPIEVTKTDVASYLDGKVSNMQHRIRSQESMLQSGHTVLYSDDESNYPAEIQRLQTMKQAVARGEYGGIAIELDRDIAIQQGEMDYLLNKIRAGFSDDPTFFHLMQETKEGEEVMKTIPDVAKPWFTKRMDDLTTERQKTSRGHAVDERIKAGLEKKHLEQLKQVVLRPPSP